MGLRRLRGRLDQLQSEGNHTMDVVQDLVADCKDGVGVKVRPLKGFSAFVTRLVLAVITFLVATLLHKLAKYVPFVQDPDAPPQLDLSWMEGVDIPLLLSIDPTIDVDFKDEEMNHV